jgi:hypothetical protein
MNGSSRSSSHFSGLVLRHVKAVKGLQSAVQLEVTLTTAMYWQPYVASSSNDPEFQVDKIAVRWKIELMSNVYVVLLTAFVHLDRHSAAESTKVDRKTTSTLVSIIWPPVRQHHSRA